MKKLFFVFLASVALASCQPLAKHFGGTFTIDLPKNTKLVNASWKKDSLWYLTRIAKPDEKPETYEYLESSTFGLVQGKVIFVEH